MKLNEILKKERQNKGLSIRELSKTSGVNASYISRLERGIDTSPGLEVIAKIASALGVPVNNLIGRKNGIQNLIDDTIKYKNVTLEKIASKTNIDIENLKQLYSGSNYSVDDFNIIQNSFWGTYEDYINTCPRIMIESISKKRSEEDKTIDALLTILKHYYGHNVSDITDLSKTDFSKKKIIILNLDNKEIQYTREEINEFLKFVALSFPNFKFINKNLQNKK